MGITASRIKLLSLSVFCSSSLFFPLLSFSSLFWSRSLYLSLSSLPLSSLFSLSLSLSVALSLLSIALSFSNWFSPFSHSLTLALSCDEPKIYTQSKLDDSMFTFYLIIKNDCLYFYVCCRYNLCYCCYFLCVLMVLEWCGAWCRSISDYCVWQCNLLFRENLCN